MAVGQSRRKKIIELIEQFKKNQEPLILWGAGAFVMELMKTSDLSKCNIAAFVDNNPLKIGKEYGGKKIIAPSELIMIEGSILICSMLSTEDIVRQIKDMKLKHKIYAPLK